MDILKKYKHGELGADQSLKSKEKLDSKLMPKYKHGELSADQGKKKSILTDHTINRWL